MTLITSLVRRIFARASRLEPPLQRAFERGFRTLLTTMPSEAKLAASLTDIEALLSKELSPREIEKAFAGVKAELQASVIDSSRLTIRDVNASRSAGLSPLPELRRGANAPIPKPKGTFLYHSTPIENLASIRKTGLHPGPAGAFFTKEWSTARMFGAQMAHGIKAQPGQSGAAIMLRTALTKAFKKDPRTGHYITWDIVTPEHLELEKEIDKFQPLVQKALRQYAQTVPAPEIAFDYLDPKVIDGIRKLQSTVMEDLSAGVRETVRVIVREGLEKGMGPRAIARDLRALLPLGPTQAAAVMNFRGLLEAGDREALTRALRDRRFDGTLRAALGQGGKGLSPEQIDTMTGAYAGRAIAHNAITIARTATLDATKLGQQLSYEQAVQQGAIAKERLWKRWRTAGDDRVRDEHVAMEGEEQPYDSPYSNGQMVPGETDYNCRCISIYFQREKGT